MLKIINIYSLHEMLCFFKNFKFSLIRLVLCVKLAQLLLLFVSVDNSVHFSSKLNLQHLTGCVRSILSLAG